MSLRKPYAIGLTIAAVAGISGLTAVGVSYAGQSSSRGTAVFFADSRELCNQIGERLVRAGEIRQFECTAKVGLVNLQDPTALPALFDTQRECTAAIRNPRLQQCTDGFAVIAVGSAGRQRGAILSTGEREDSPAPAPGRPDRDAPIG